MSYTIDAKQNLIRITGSGRLTNAEMVVCVGALRSDAKLKSDMSTLSDMRGIEVEFTSNGIRQMISVMHGAPAGRVRAKAAIVVSTDLSFGMGRMFEAYTDDETDPSFQIFRNLGETEAWLDSN